MISFKTDHERRASGAHKYTITVETDIKRYYEAVQAVARDCVDDSTKSHNHETDVVTPCIEAVDGPDFHAIRYLCSWCECDLSPVDRGFFVHCPRCGKKIDYSTHDFMREGRNAIR